MVATATKNCEWCGALYERHRSFGREQWAVSRFCSRQCRGESIKGIKTGPKPHIWAGKETPCGHCGKLFYVFPYAKKFRRFCSKSCGYEGRVLKGEFKKGHPDVVSAEARKRAGAKASISLTGRKLSRAHIEAVSAKMRGRKLSREHIRNSLRRRPMSSLEVKFESLAKEMSLPYKFVGNGSFFVERKNPDFIHSGGSKIAIEVFYRRHKERFSGGLDNWRSNREAIFNNHGWKIIFLDETMVNKTGIGREVCHFG